MIYLVLSILFTIAAHLVPGVIALVRAAGSPSGKGLIFAGGGLLALCGVAIIGWRIWYDFAILAPFGNTVAGGPMPYMGLVATYNIVRPVLVTIAIGLLLFAVLSARGKGQPTAPSPHGFPQPQPAQGHHVPPHHPGHPGQPYGHQAPGAPQQRFQAPQQPQPPQAPTGPQHPGQPQAPSGPQRPQGPTGPQPPQGPQPGQR
ncbi:hypothetical protein [Nocardiopsis lucentensis]|uniref:hypothetical protein n=1 Tax=Nocardiopsis lucentensis TaxID=53441 RepID=UPI00034D71B2|nr:hypothetical protein [Nocardiopsis lucentensis]